MEMVFSATDRGDGDQRNRSNWLCGSRSKGCRAVSSFYNVQCIYSPTSSANAVLVVVSFTQFEPEGLQMPHLMGMTNRDWSRTPQTNIDL